MANPTLLFMNPGSVTYTGSGAGFSNLNDYDRLTTWSAGDTTTGQYIQIDRGSASKVTHIALDNHNLPTITEITVVVSGSNSADFSTNTVLHGNICAAPYRTNDPTLIPLTTTGSFRYVRVQVYATPDPIGEAFALGSFWVGEALVLDSPFDVPARFENAQFQTFEGVSLNGNLRTSQVYSGGRIVDEVRFSVQTDATANLIRSFVQAVKGRRYPFFFAEDTSEVADARMMHFAEDYVPVETLGYNLNGVSMRLRTHESRF